MKRSVEGRFLRRLLKWFRGHRRSFPWRETTDPYRVFVAEFMLQRTGAQQVLPVYRNFIEQFPDLRRAAQADEDAIRRTLRPLGRVKRYKVLARALGLLAATSEGRVPRSLGRLLEIPGVGLYTARAVLVFAHGRRLGLFDPNIYRVISRVFGLSSSRPRAHTDPVMWSTVDRLIPRGMSREMNLALLDFAAAICRLKPRCPTCPMNDICDYYRRTGT